MYIQVRFYVSTPNIYACAKQMHTCAENVKYMHTYYKNVVFHKFVRIEQTHTQKEIYVTLVTICRMYILLNIRIT